jgi:ABC-type bacteriocin/lantibiotic exporter with double-glycine peptidase domain
MILEIDAAALQVQVIVVDQTSRLNRGLLKEGTALGKRACSQEYKA